MTYSIGWPIGFQSRTSDPTDPCFIGSKAGEKNAGNKNDPEVVLTLSRQMFPKSENFMCGRCHKVRPLLGSMVRLVKDQRRRVCGRCCAEKFNAKHNAKQGSIDRPGMTKA